jgi:hypothetical protein
VTPMTLIRPVKYSLIDDINLYTFIAWAFMPKYY